jgi:hypothetical protein
MGLFCLINGHVEGYSFAIDVLDEPFDILFCGLLEQGLAHGDEFLLAGCESLLAYLLEDGA